MKRNIILFLFMMLAFIFQMQAQNINVKSFRLLDNDLDARVNYPKKDQNGEKCALIKVVTTEIGFSWDGDALGIVSSEKRTGEYWLYVPHGAKRLSIMHDKLGVLRNYAYPLPIEEANVYELVLTTGKVVTTVVEEIESKWLLITATPDNAMIYLDNVLSGTGNIQKKLKPGKYEYRIEATNYHNSSGIIEINNENVTQTIHLLPAFGFLQINSLPENGATISIDSKQIHNQTPTTSDTLPSGEHLITVNKQMFQPVSQKVIVKDNETVPVTLQMLPNFAEVEINAPKDAIIYINNVNKGTENWKGRLDAGIYTIEARKEKHTTHKKDIEVKAGEKLTYELTPTPQYGKLDVVSQPPMATITINGKNYGTTPTTINNLLIGDYTIELSLQGYASKTEKVTITEGQTITVNTTLVNGREVNITSTPTGVDLYIDNNKVGVTPYKAKLTFGEHILRIEERDKKAEKQISIAQNGFETSFSLSFEPTVTDIDGNVYNTLKIGTQTWFKENLNTTHYRNGDAIPNITDKEAWIILTKGAYCNFDNEDNNAKTYGKLYNFYAVVDKRDLCPTGWHVPSDAEWSTLTTSLGGDKIAGDKLKEAGLAHWNSPNTGATNETGFTALPAGFRKNYIDRVNYETFFSIGLCGFWWSSTESNTTYTWHRSMNYKDNEAMRGGSNKQYGLSVRCIKDL